MSLTFPKGPLSENPAGELNVEVEPHLAVLYLEPMPYRIRALFEGETVVDSLRPFLLHETGQLPVYYFLAEDVHRDLLKPSKTALEDG